MNKWFVSDTHFSHTNIIRYTGRPFQSVNEMDERLIENWNALVEPQDTVFFLGDFGLGTTLVLTEELFQYNGRSVRLKYFCCQVWHNRTCLVQQLIQYRVSIS